jgi:hypothetical protein
LSRSRGFDGIIEQGIAARFLTCNALQDDRQHIKMPKCEIGIAAEFLIHQPPGQALLFRRIDDIDIGASAAVPDAIVAGTQTVEEGRQTHGEITRHTATS